MVIYRYGQKQMSGKLIDRDGRDLDKETMKYRHRSLSKKSQENARIIETGQYE